jgi:hypothetical protein
MVRAGRGPPIVFTLEVPLMVILVARIVQRARVVDVEVIAVAWVVVAGIEIQAPSPDGIHRLITPDYRSRITPQQSTFGLRWLVLGGR